MISYCNSIICIKSLIMYLFLLIFLLILLHKNVIIISGETYMNNILVIKSKSNKVKSVINFKSVELAEACFKKQSYQINKKLNEDFIENCLDDGVCESKNTSICLTHNSDNLANPNYAIVILVDNIHEESFLYEKDYQARDSFVDLIQYYDSNYNDYKSKDITKIADKGYLKINNRTLNLVKIEKSPMIL